MGNSNSTTSNKYSSYAKKEYNAHHVTHLIKSHRLAPFHKPSDDNPIECPICFLKYPRDTNYTVCCSQPICSDCFTQIKCKRDTNDTTTITTTTSATCSCPFCCSESFAIVYADPSSFYFNSPPPVNKMDLSLVNSLVKSSDIYPEPKKKQQDLRQLQQLNMYLGPTINGTATARRGGSSSNSNNAAERQRAFAQAATLTASAMEGRNIQLLNAFRTMGADLEELMLMEAIRQSLLVTSSNTNTDENNDTTVDYNGNNSGDNHDDNNKSGSDQIHDTHSNTSSSSSSSSSNSIKQNGSLNFPDNNSNMDDIQSMAANDNIENTENIAKKEDQNNQLEDEQNLSLTSSSTVFQAHKSMNFQSGSKSYSSALLSNEIIKCEAIGQGQQDYADDNICIPPHSPLSPSSLNTTNFLKDNGFLNVMSKQEEVTLLKSRLHSDSSKSTLPSPTTEMENLNVG